MCEADEVYIKKLEDEVTQLEEENQRLRELMRDAPLDDWGLQCDPEFEQRWSDALKEGE